MRESSATGGGGAARFGREGGDPELDEDEAEDEATMLGAETSSK